MKASARQSESSDEAGVASGGTVGDRAVAASVSAAGACLRVGCVSFINSKPLIHGLEESAERAGATDSARPHVRFDVPSQLLEDLETDEVDIALCPVIDYFRSASDLVIVPASCIGCDGPTLTVRLYSQLPLNRLSTIHADTDSHTSVNLLRVLMWRLHGLKPTLIDYHARERVARAKLEPWPEAMLLIGDKVVADAPPAVRYPHQLDLGEAWRELTGLPFVFAVWLAKSGRKLGTLPALLKAQYHQNAARLDELVARYAGVHGWPADLTRRYYLDYLRFEFGPRQIEAVRRFADEAHALGLIGKPKPLRLFE